MISDTGMDATQEHEEAEEPVSSYYFNLANLSSSSHARLSYMASSFQVRHPVAEARIPPPAFSPFRLYNPPGGTISHSQLPG